MKRILVLLALATLSGCATSPREFYASPTSHGTNKLCRTVLNSQDPAFRADIGAELERRGETRDSCVSRIDTENAVIAGVAIAGAAVAIGVAAHNGAFDGMGGGGGNAYGYAWDGFNTQNGYRWACRDRSNGQFAYESMCAGLAQVDNTWPG